MANFVYKKAKESMLSGELNLVTNSLKVAFLDTSFYTPNQNTDEFLSDVPTAAKKYRSSALSNVSNDLGVLDADDLTIIHSGVPFNAIVFYQFGTVDSDSRLIAFIDSSEGLPFSGTAEPSAMTLQWNNSLTKIISL
jgi:hypothetical protein